MSEANASTTSPETGSGASISTLESRSAEAFGLPDPTADAVAAPVAQEPDAAAHARATRREALSRLETEERGRVDAMATRRQNDDLRAKNTALEAAAKSYEGHIDPRKLSKAEFFALAEQNPELSPHELGEWLREAHANPERAAARAAAQAVDPKLSALESRIAAQQKVIDDFVSSQEDAKGQAEEAAAAHEFFAFTADNAATSPFSSRFLARHGEQEYLKLAQRAAQDVPPNAGAQAILDEIEENLAQLGHIYSADTAAPQRRQATAPHSAAAQAPTTISNTLAQQRTSVVDEDGDWAALPFEERSARLFR